MRPARRGRPQSESIANYWWLFAEPCPTNERCHLALLLIRRYIPQSRSIAYLYGSIRECLPDHQLIAIARDDDTTFGILHSRFHEAWSLRLGTSLEDRPRYTPTTTFETFPFPEGLTPNIPAADYAGDPRAMRIAAAAKRLDELRRAWLNPPDLVDIVPEITPTAAPGEAPRRYPDRIVPKTAEAAAKLKERTLTNLYNQRPRWLADAHEALDRAVAAAYGWPEDIATDDALARLLALNLERAQAQGGQAASGTRLTASPWRPREIFRANPSGNSKVVLGFLPCQSRDRRRMFGDPRTTPCRGWLRHITPPICLICPPAGAEKFFVWNRP